LKGSDPILEGRASVKSLKKREEKRRKGRGKWREDSQMLEPDEKFALKGWEFNWNAIELEMPAGRGWNEGDCSLVLTRRWC